MGLNVIQLARASARLALEPYHLPSIVEAFDAVAEFKPMVALYERMLGGLPQAERDHLEALSRKPLDLDACRAMPEGTLGRGVAHFLDDNGLFEDYYKRAYAPVVDKLDRNWVMLRFARTHDYHHVVTGLPPDIPGEMALQIINTLNFREPYGLATVALLPWSLVVYHRAGVGKTMSTIVRSLWGSRKAQNMFVFPWEDHLETPVVELRRRLGLPEAGLMPG